MGLWARQFGRHRRVIGAGGNQNQQRRVVSVVVALAAAVPKYRCPMILRGGWVEQIATMGCRRIRWACPHKITITMQPVLVVDWTIPWEQ